MVGIETAEYLITQQKNVTIVEMREDDGIDMQASAKYFSFKTLDENNVRILRNTKVKEINSTCVVCSEPDGDFELHGFDTTVMAIGSRSYNPLEDKLRDFFIEYHEINAAPLTYLICGWQQQV